MNKSNNPLRAHYIGASGCDGSIKGFIESRITRMKYNPLDGIQFPFDLLCELAVESKGEPVKKLLQWMRDTERSVTRSMEAFSDQEQSMVALWKAIEKVDAQIEEIVNPELTEPATKGQP